MPPMLRNPRGPEGRNDNPYHHPDLHRGSRQDAGVDGVYELRNVSRRTRRRYPTLNADHRHIRTQA